VLGRYLTGDATPEDRARLAQWATTPHRRRLLAASRESHLSDSARTARMWDVLRQRVGIGLDSKAREPRIVSHRGMTAGRGSEGRSLFQGPRGLQKQEFSWWRTAVMGVAPLAIVAVVALWWTARTNTQTTSPTGHAYATQAGQRATIVLVDGTRVRLAPQTVLRLAPGFGTSTRDVSLAGEAYFDVAHTRGAPFLVRTRTATARVLGTTFDVRTYPADSAVAVTVVSGKVAVAPARTGRPNVTLTAGMIATVHDSSATIAVGDASHPVLWTDGQLVFRNAPTSAVLAALTRWYGYPFRVADSTLTHGRLTVVLSTESSQAALTALKEVMNVNLTFDHGVVVLSRRVGARTTPHKQDTLSPQEMEVGR